MRRQLLYFCELSNKNIRNIKLMFVESQNVANFSIQQIMKNVWVKVAEKNIGKMVPINVQLMNVHTFQSIAQLNSQLLQDRDGFNKIEQKSCIQKDNYLNHYQKVQKKQVSKLEKLNQLPNISDIKSKVSKYKDSKRTTKNVFSDNMPSGNQSKVTSQRTKDQKNNIKFISLDTLDIRLSSNGVNKYQQTNRKIQALRTKIVYTEELQHKQDNELKSNQVKALQRKQVLLKKQKQIQRFTYDYDGQFFASKLSNPQNTLGSAARIKSEFQKQTPKNVKKQKMKPLFTLIANDKIEERHKRQVTQELQNENNKKLYKQSLATMLANSLSQDEDVSQGISIKETYSNFCKSNPLKHKITLSQFKNQIANKKFKQFRFKPVKNVTQTDNVNVVNRISSYKSQQFFVENNRNRNHTTVQVQKSQKIPSVRNNIRYKTIFSSEHNSILSNSKYSAASSKIKQGAIKVSNPSLYQTFCQQTLA